MSSRILLVGDTAETALLLVQLQQEGYDVLQARRGQAALVMAEEQQPSVILLDATASDKESTETCRRLRINPATTHIPVIWITNQAHPDARANGLLAGATDYLTLPIHLPELLGRLERLARLNADISAEHTRLLEEMAYTALAALSVDMAWLLAADVGYHWLLHRSLAFAQAEGNPAQEFLALIADERVGVRFPLVRGNNPLAEVVLHHQVVLNASPNEVRQMPGGDLFAPIFEQFQFPFLTFVPLLTAQRAVGVMVLGARDAPLADSQQVRQLLNSLCSQAAMVVDNAYLLADLAARDAQMRAEQAFRQMVLDTMGEGLVVLDEEATVTYVNARLLQLTEYRREELYGHSVGTIFHPSDREALVASLKGARRATLPFAQRLYTRRGKTIPVLLSRAVAPSPDGRGTSTVLVLTDLSELQRNEEALRLQTLRLEALTRAANAISSASSFQEVVQVSLEAALQVVRGKGAALWLRDEEASETLTVIASLGSYDPRLAERHVLAGRGAIGRVVTTATARLLRLAQHDEPTRAEYMAVVPDAVPRSVMLVPLIAFDEVIGVLEVVEKAEGVFDAQDLATLESLAGSAAVTLENTRLFEQTRRRVTELSTLLDASAAVTSTLDFGDILRRIARRLSVALQVQRVVIADWHKRTNTLVALAEVVNAYWPPQSAPTRQAAEMPLAVSVARSGKTIFPRLSSYGAGADAQAERNPSGLVAIAGFPLRIGGRVVGVLTLYSENPHQGLSSALAREVSEVVSQWQEVVAEYDAEDWHSRPNLTDLCQRLLHTTDVQWCSVFAWQPEAERFRLLREMGHALWLERSEQVWAIEQYPSLHQVLERAEPLVLHPDTLAHDPHTRAYLQQMGGYACLVAPLLIRGEASGLVQLIDTEHVGRTFDRAEISLCQGIANVVGNAMENAQLYTAQEQRASALEAAYKELQEADQLKDELLQNLSHELRTPLTHILGYLRLMLDGAFGPLSAEQRQTLELVTGKAEHLARLVKDIVSVQETKAYNLVPKAVQLERVINGAVRTMVAKARAKNIRIVPRLAADLPPAYVDPVRIGEVFEELLENAIKFSPSDSQIEIWLEDPGGLMLHARVCDQGIGIPPEEHEKIFWRFYQVDGSTTRRYGGTGLGLAIVRQVVEGLNGRVWVESAPGVGSCFHLTLPKAEAATNAV